ncbi:MAG: hypothetical protein S4CHLAM123_05140 [Chlamydiales bacterium]|nr:hypothetical protein [Chlamydiales bacterium]
MKYKLLLLLLLVPQFSFAACSPFRCSRFQLPGWWGSAEYLLMWRKERFYPPLLTTNSNPLVESPILGDPDTRILFGDETLGSSPSSGWGINGGLWLTPCFGLGGTLLFPGDEKNDFDITGNSEGNPIFGRPFFNTALNVNEASRLSDSVEIIVDGENVINIDGFFEANITNRVFIGDFYGRFRSLSSCNFNLDFLFGFMYSNIDDRLEINDSTTVFNIDIMMAVDIDQTRDFFDCKNEYCAALFGFCSEFRKDCFAASVTAKVGVGNMDRRTNIEGSLIATDLRTDPATVVVETHGLLAQPSNIGKRSSQKFEVVPQIQGEIKWRVLPHAWLSAGYLGMYWPDIALAGRLVDLNVNPTQNPEFGPLTGPLAPLFDLNAKSFWMHGFTAGIYILY